MSQLALQLIAEAKRTNAKVLDLGNCGLTELPDELFELTALEELNLSNHDWDNKFKSKNQGKANKLSQIKCGISDLKALKILRIKGDVFNKVQISDYFFLENMTTLQTLYLSYNKISDISFLEKLTGLQGLDLSSNQISDISYLRNLTGLQGLKLSSNKISDISFLKKLTGLQHLHLGLNKITDYSFLEEMIGLQTLDLSFNEISNISFLEKLTGLQMLGLRNNKISDISFLKKLTRLQTLDLSSNQILDISILEKLTRLQMLDLSLNKISDISILEKLTGLQTLNLLSNKISDISFLKKLRGLQTLNLLNNKISDISFLENLTQLQTLNLSSNIISDYSFLRNLTALQMLDLSNNQISDISILENLTGLQRLDLSSNQISDIFFLKKLTNLQKLKLSSNQISDISFMENLTGLQELKLSSNQISDISFLENLTGLQELNLCYNKISNISFLENLAGLQSLDLQGNQITNIELSLLNQLKNLIVLSLYGNQLENIDDNIIGEYNNNCLTDLRIYLEDLKGGITKNNTAKLIFVGNGEVGKTQIAKRMVDAENYIFDSQHRSTHAISLLHKHLPCSFLPKGLDLTLWDFAGQDIYHASHRLFMQTKAIFILVWDTKTEKANHHTYNNKKYNNRELLYWLEYIKHFSDNSPIVLLQNKVDEEEMANQKLPAITINAYKEDYNVVRQIQVSAKTGKGFPVLEHTIKNLFKENGVLSSALLKELPNSWVAVREKIYQAMEQDVKTTSIAQFEAYCATEEIKKSSNTVLKFFHNTGVLFYRSGYFNNQIIVDQAWAIEAVYKVFDRDSDYFEILIDKEEGKKGQLDYEDICMIWKNNTDDERELFIDFMLSCELCFESTKNKKYSTPLYERHFVIPQFLPSKPASLNFYFKEYNISREEQSRQYTFLPEVYIHRFIINAHQFAQPDEIWTNGILLYYAPENAYAMVEADYDRACIHIQYSPNCINLLEAIHKQLDKIAQEGKIKPLALTDQDPKAFGKKVIQGFKDLLPNTYADINRAQPKKVFISYAKADVDLVEKGLVRSLINLERQEKITIWYDKKLQTGEEWDSAIKQQLQEADIILLVVSPDFINSDYIWDVEIEKALDRHEKGTAKVLPVILRPCDWLGAATPFSKLQATPTKGKPITSFEDIDEAWLEVLQQIKRVIG